MPEKPTHLDLFSGIRSADLPLPLDGLGSKPSASARSTNTARKSLRRTFWPTPESQPAHRKLTDGKSISSKGQRWGISTEQAVRLSQTSETSTDETLPASPSSQADFLANLSARPGSEEARRMTVTSGRKCCELLRKHDPLGCLARMLLESSAWNSTLCYLTWKASATPCGRPLFQLAVSMPRTSGTGSGLWPTPKQQNSCGAGIHGQGGMDSQTQVKMWPTANSRDWKDTMTGTHPPSRPKPSEQTLGQAVSATGIVGGSLNPTWVEWLQGFPIGWTEID